MSKKSTTPILNACERERSRPVAGQRKRSPWPRHQHLDLDLGQHPRHPRRSLRQPRARDQQMPMLRQPMSSRGQSQRPPCPSRAGPDSNCHRVEKVRATTRAWRVRRGLTCPCSTGRKRSTTSSATSRRSSVLRSSRGMATARTSSSRSVGPE
mgnify:CR=1 FL=1